jgi:signal transduction histidine kinase
LLTNAVTFTKTGTIIVNAKVKENTGDGQVIVSVRDTGSGIDPEIAPRLFTKFASKSDSGTELLFGLKITLMEEGQHSVLHYH